MQSMGTIDNVDIGKTTINEIIIKSGFIQNSNVIIGENNVLDIRKSEFLVDDGSISGNKISGGTIDNINIKIGKGNKLDLNGGEIIFTNDSISGNAINGGTIDKIEIKELTISKLNDSLTIKSGLISDDSGELSFDNNNLTTTGIINTNTLKTNNLDIPEKSINGNKISGGTIENTNITINSDNILDLRNGSLFLSDNSISGNKISGGTINNTNISIDNNNIIDVRNGTILFSDNSISGNKIDGGLIDNTDIEIGLEKTLDVRNGTVLFSDNSISGNSINGGIIDSIEISNLISDNSIIRSGLIQDTDIYVGLGNVLDLRNAELILDDDSISGNAINGGTINNVDIDLTGKILDARNGTILFSDISGNSINGGTINNVDIDLTDKILDSRNGTILFSDNSISGNKINGGTINNVDIDLTAKTLDARNGTILFSDNSISGNSINGGIIDKIEIKDLKIEKLNNTLTIDSGLIKDSSGEISLYDNNLTTTGTITAKTIIAENLDVNQHTIKNDDKYFKIENDIIVSNINKIGLNELDPESNLHISGGNSGLEDNISIILQNKTINDTNLGNKTSIKFKDDIAVLGSIEVDSARNQNSQGRMSFYIYKLCYSKISNGY